MSRQARPDEQYASLSENFVTVVLSHQATSLWNQWINTTRTT